MIFKKQPHWGENVPWTASNLRRCIKLGIQLNHKGRYTAQALSVGVTKRDARVVWLLLILKASCGENDTLPYDHILSSTLVGWLSSITFSTNCLLHPR